MTDLVVIGIVALVIVLASVSVWRAKKKGQRCIGCPSGGCSSCAGCSDRQ